METQTDFSIQNPPPAPAPKKPNTWVIVVVVLGVLCCFCIGIIGLLIAFGGDILNALGLQSILPILTNLH